MIHIPVANFGTHPLHSDYSFSTKYLVCNEMLLNRGITYLAVNRVTLLLREQKSVYKRNSLKLSTCIAALILKFFESIIIQILIAIIQLTLTELWHRFTLHGTYHDFTNSNVIGSISYLLFLIFQPQRKPINLFNMRFLFHYNGGNS